MKPQTQPIVITGFMAAGKTSVATALAQKLGCAMIDLDHFIESREGRTAQEIIDQDGEKRFREIEALALHAALETEGARIIALGGGTWTIPSNRKLIDAHNAFTVWLDAPFPLCWSRIAAQTQSRPLARDLTQAKDLYMKRRPFYEQATLRIEVGENKSIDAVASEITETLTTLERSQRPLFR